MSPRRQEDNRRREGDGGRRPDERRSGGDRAKGSGKTKSKTDEARGRYFPRSAWKQGKSQGKGGKDKRRR